MNTAPTARDNAVTEDLDRGFILITTRGGWCVPTPRLLIAPHPYALGSNNTRDSEKRGLLWDDDFMDISSTSAHT